MDRRIITPLLRDRLIFLDFAACGLFRPLHEFMRETPEMLFGLSGYQIIAFVLMITGAWQLTKGPPRTRPDSA